MTGSGLTKNLHTKSPASELGAAALSAASIRVLKSTQTVYFYFVSVLQIFYKRKNCTSRVSRSFPIDVSET